MFLMRKGLIRQVTFHITYKVFLSNIYIINPLQCLYSIYYLEK